MTTTLPQTSTFDPRNPYPAMVGLPQGPNATQMWCEIQKHNVDTYVQNDVRGKTHRFCFSCGTERLSPAR